MNYLEEFCVTAGSHVRPKNFDPRFAKKRVEEQSAPARIEKHQRRMDELQFQLSDKRKRSPFICLQAPDAGGKDGAIRHVIGSTNPRNRRGSSFRRPASEEWARDFLRRIERRTPKRDEVVVFNRSHYEDVLVARVHDLVPNKP